MRRKVRSSSSATPFLLALLLSFNIKPIAAFWRVPSSLPSSRTGRRSSTQYHKPSSPSSPLYSSSSSSSSFSSSSSTATPPVLSDAALIKSEKEGQEQQKLRKIAFIRQFARLPIWPIWNGLLIMLIDQVGFKKLSQTLEAKIGGRVSPMIFLPPPSSESAEGPSPPSPSSQSLLPWSDPIILMVHHRHSFFPLDPLRYIQRLVFPEGFPAHPHAGFCTLTYVLKGRLKHRDNMGLKQTYGDGAAQYLTAGSGVLHEEMWCFDDDEDADKKGKGGGGRGLWHKHQDIELFQLWVNLPRQFKGIEPSLQLAGTMCNQPLPEIDLPSSNTQIRLITGHYGDQTSPISTLTALSTLHVTMEGGGQSKNTSSDGSSKWIYPLPSTHTLFIYLLRGPLLVRQEGEAMSKIETHQTAFFQVGGDVLEVEAPEGAEFILVAGEPINQPVAASGPFVFTENREISQAYARYSAGQFGYPWDHNLNDEEWSKICQK